VAVKPVFIGVLSEKKVLKCTFFYDL
jgi:hypothetical protein